MLKYLVPAEREPALCKNKFSMFDSSERLANRPSTQLAPRGLQETGLRFFFEKILIEQETVKRVSDLAGSTVHVCI